MLAGRVLGPDGQPVTTYQVSAGAGREPRSWKCSSANVDDDEGCFTLPVRTDWDYDDEGKVWIGVKTPGFALWETTVDIWQGTTSIIADLRPGVAVMGTIKGREDHQGSISAELLPCRVYEGELTSDTSQRQELGRMKTPVNSSGAFRFDHTGPGTYLLAISGPTISPIRSVITVSDSDTDVGNFSPRGRGSVCGVVYEAKMICEGDKCWLDENRGVWAFADGYISFQDSSGRSNSDDFQHLKPISFKTDENGRFHVNGVPAGMVSVGFSYHITADIISAHTRNANVLEGKTTEVRFFDTSGDWEVPFEFLVGDGSPAHFSSGTGMGAKRKVANVTSRAPMLEVELKPKEDTPVSFCASDWEELDEKNPILLRDVCPGKYRLVVGDWLGSTGAHGVLCEKDVEIGSRQGKLTVALGAGCITGRMQWSRDYRHMIRVAAVGKKAHTIRHARCDDRGNFCLRYLPADDYVVFAHDYDAGWCQLPEVAANDNVTDVGSHMLVPGGTITGKLPPDLARDSSAKVEATDGHGISIENPNWYEPIGEMFTISGLWPGRWTITLKKGEEAIKRKTVAIQDTETVSCNLVVP